jgi:hypothetical protein
LGVGEEALRRPKTLATQRFERMLPVLRQLFAWGLLSIFSSFNQQPISVDMHAALPLDCSDIASPSGLTIRLSL